MHITKLDETASALLAATMAIDVIVLFRICTLRIMRTYIVRSSPMQSTKSANTEKKMELHYDFVAHMRTTIDDCLSGIRVQLRRNDAAITPLFTHKR